MLQNQHKTGFRGPSPDVGKATQFKPGNRANPGGRPKSAPLSQACRESLAAPVPDDPDCRTYAQAIAETLAQKALAGDIRAAQEIADRAEGKARQSVEIQSAEVRDAFERMSGEENSPDVRQTPNLVVSTPHKVYAQVARKTGIPSSTSGTPRESQ